MFVIIFLKNKHFTTTRPSLLSPSLMIMNAKILFIVNNEQKQQKTFICFEIN